MLDEAGFENVKIVVSGDLDEHRIHDMLAEGARFDLYGVGTKLITANEDPSLGGVYKLSAVRHEDGRWEGRLKRSDSEEKSTLPGLKQVFRLEGPDGELLGDRIDLDDEDRGDGDGDGDAVVGWAADAPDREVEIRGVHERRPMLEHVMRDGKRTRPPVELPRIRERALSELRRIPERVRRLHDPEPYPVLLGSRLRDLRRQLMRRIS
jgi:nicotinate phosphoribosyltransferase